MADTREPAPEQIRLQDIKIELEKAFPGADVLCQHGIQSHEAEVKFDEFELRVILSGPLGEINKKMSIRFLQRIERNKQRIFFDRRPTDWYELVDAIGEARAHIRGLVHALTTVLNPKRSRDFGTIADILAGD